MAELPICGIGASAGGLEPLELFFDEMPVDSGLAFVVIQHLSPDHKSLMPELLARRTTMPVMVAENGVPIEANHVYLIPPLTDMTIEEGHLLLRARERRETPPRPIDTFMSSLASYPGPKVSIVLSGTGRDGSRGIVKVHEQEGLVLAQDHSAAFIGMPDAARDTKRVHASLAPMDMPAAILDWLESGKLPEEVESASVGVDAVMEILRQSFALDFSQYKPSTVTRRIARRIQMARIDNVDSYIAKLQEDEEERHALYADLLIGVTGFFRDHQAYDSISRALLDPMRRAGQDQRSFRIWVPACATGEEAYSIAMCCLEICDRLTNPPQIQIYATDVHQRSIDTASRGLYQAENLEELSRERLRRFFTLVGGSYRVNTELRAMITFAQHNLLQDAPFTRIDLVSCRNVLIYFRTAAQHQALSSLHFALRSGGLLFLGASESLGAFSQDFDELDRSWRLFRKVRDEALRKYRRIPLGMTVPRGRRRPDVVLPHPIVTPDQRLLRVYDALLEAQFTSAALVNETRELVHTFGTAGEWLRQPKGRPTLDVLKMIPSKRIAAAVGSGLRRALQDGEDVSYGGIENDDGTDMIVSVRPIRVLDAVYAIIAIHARPDTTPQVLTQPYTELGERDDQLRQMEHELQYTRENLQAAVEELETSNEELNASNEELIASNEELQSTNEELSSVNEELRTLNDEYHSKVNDLSTLTSDLDVLLASTDLSILFLGPRLELRRYTPTALQFFKIRETDVGRPFDEIARTVHVDGLEDRIREVNRGELAELEQEVEYGGKDYLLRLLPYGARKEAGVVLMLVDVTELMVLRSEIEHERAQFHSFLRNAPAAVAAKDADGRYVLANGPTLEAMGAKSPDAVIGHFDRELIDPDNLAIIRRIDEQVLQTGQSVDAELRGAPNDPDAIWLSNRFRFYDTRGVPLVGVMSIPVSNIGILSRSIARAEQQGSWLARSGVQVLTLVDGTLRDQAGTRWLHHPLDERGLRAVEKDTDERVRIRLRTDEEAPWRWFEVLTDAESVLVRDVHEEESELRTLREELERDRANAHAQERELLSEVDTLRLKNDELDRFAHVAAHDLKAPVRSVRAFADLALVATEAGEDATEYIQQILTSGQRMGELLEKLLEFAAAGALIPNASQVDLGAVVDSLQLDLAHALNDADGRLLLEHQAPLWADTTAVKQILQNFVSNALKFGGDAPTVLIRTEARDGGTVLSVTDNGVGFEQERAAAIFEPFTRLHSTRRYPGSGIGLSICKRMVEGHGGRVWAVSSPGAGTTVSAWFPDRRSEG